MLGVLAIILLVIWGGGLILHVLGGFIYIFLVVGIIMGIAHFLTGNSNKGTSV